MKLAEKQIVLARLQTTSSNLRLCLGTFCGDRNELIREVENESTIGEELVEIYMFGLKSFNDFAIPNQSRTNKKEEK